MKTVSSEIWEVIDKRVGSLIYKTVSSEIWVRVQPHFYKLIRNEIDDITESEVYKELKK